MLEIKKRKEENNQKTIYRRYKVAGLNWKKVVDKFTSQSKSNKSATKIFTNNKNKKWEKNKREKVKIRVKKQP